MLASSHCCTSISVEYRQWWCTCQCQCQCYCQCYQSNSFGVRVSKAWISLLLISLPSMFVTHLTVFCLFCLLDPFARRHDISGRRWRRRKLERRLLARRKSKLMKWICGSNNAPVDAKFQHLFYCFISFFPNGRGTLLQVSPITAGPL